MMKFKRCEFGHYYDPSKYETCPHCFARQSGAEAEYTVAKKPLDAPVGRRVQPEPEEEPIAAPVRRAVRTPAPEPEEPYGGQPAGPDNDPVTVAKARHSAVVDSPVVGWLAQIAGANVGCSFEVRQGRNTIGRAANMDICIKGDVGVSRDTNGVILYDARTRVCQLVPGENKAMIYLNDQELLAPEALQAYDKIEIGDTALLFMPLCGEYFGWDDRMA